MILILVCTLVLERPLEDSQRVAYIIILGHFVRWQGTVDTATGGLG